MTGQQSLVVVVRAIVGPFDVDPANPVDAVALVVLVQVVGAAGRAPRGLQEGVVRAAPVLGLVQQDVEGLLVDASLGELHLRKGRGRSLEDADTSNTL